MWHLASPDAAERAIDVPVPRVLPRRRGCRVVTRVDGRGIWFESADVTLAPSCEAFGAALLVPALHAGRTLRITGDACAEWAANLAGLTTLFRSLWYPGAPTPLVVPAGRRGSVPREMSAALCFSGGVDAFHTLLTARRAIDVLALVVGYDVRIRDGARAAAVTALVHEVAAETGRRGVVIATNLRRHPLLRDIPWLRAFGGPLAAVGHLLRDTVGHVLISSDGLGFEDPEVGSRDSTDRLHGSERVAVEHVAPAVTRLEKIRAIAGEPIVQKHLRVCWKNVNGLLNCGRCEKCVRTMLALDACGMLGRFPGLDRGAGLVSAIEALPVVDRVVEPFYRDLSRLGLAPAAAAAVRRLLDRTAVSRPEAEPAPRVTRRVPRAFASILRATGLRSRATRPQSSCRGPRAAERHRLCGIDAFAVVLAPLLGRRVGYVRPEGNVGDRLIEVAMIQLFAAYGIHWRLWRPDVPGDAEGLDLLAFGGGGNMGMRYPGNQALRGRALATGLPVIVLPQSFTSAEDRPFAAVFVRERASLTLRPDGVLAPDLALGLATTAPRRPDRGLGVFLRRDQERAGRKPALARDPVRLCRDPLAYLALAARYERILTDRLHFAIAGLHAGRDVTLVANDYHKNASMHATWLAAFGCRFAATPGEARVRPAA